MTKFLEFVNEFVWGIPTLVLILGVGLYLSAATGFAQLRLLPKSVTDFFRRLTRQESGNSSPFQALCTALAATVGTGNLVGVAGAIALGGPGAIFWMWLAALLGMMTKFAEAALAVRYRQRSPSGEYVGGPMYMIRNGLNNSWAWLGSLYCFFGVVAAFGVGNATQINAMLGGINSVITAYGGEQSVGCDLIIGICLAVCIGAMLLGGARRIGNVAQMLVPFAAAAYLLLCTGALILCRDALPKAFASILVGAFSPEAVTGGMVGSAFTALRIGVSRGVFTNEAGMGTASIAHAGAQVDHPAQQGLMGIMEVFLDTVVICTMTALVILSSGISVNYGLDEGAQLTADAFSAVYGDWVRIPLAGFLVCFAFATVLGWGLYGARCAQFLFGHRAWNIFAFIQAAAVIPAAVMNTGTVWLLSDIVNALMAFPNLVALVLLSPELIRLTKEYRIHLGGKNASGGTYENFNQCQSL